MVSAGERQVSGGTPTSAAGAEPPSRQDLAHSAMEGRMRREGVLS
jgi:hypothetical protein